MTPKLACWFTWAATTQVVLVWKWRCTWLRSTSQKDSNTMTTARNKIWFTTTHLSPLKFFFQTWEHQRLPLPFSSMKMTRFPQWATGGKLLMRLDPTRWNCLTFSLEVIYRPISVKKRTISRMLRLILSKSIPELSSHNKNKFWHTWHKKLIKKRFGY